MPRALPKDAFSGLGTKSLKHKSTSDSDTPPDSKTQDADIFEGYRKYLIDKRRQYQSSVRETDEQAPQCRKCSRDLERCVEEDNNFTSAFLQDQWPEDTYRYDVLPDRNWFRLLELEPATIIDAPLRACLRTYPSRTCITYVALSYTWAGVETKGSLDLLGGNMRISGNLEQALRALRLPNSIIRVWVDAVCINQHNNAEKGIQVAGMPDTYRRAKYVLGWLGPEGENTGVALDYMRQLARLSKRNKYNEHTRMQIIPILGLHSFPLKSQDAAEIEAMRSTKHLNEIYDKAWFTRFWVTQEIHFARRLTLQIGSQSLQWKDFRRATIMLHAVSCQLAAANIRPNSIDAYTRAFLLVNNRDHRQSLSGNTSGLEDNTSQIYGMFERFHQWQCNDERDRIYALLGTVPKDSEVTLKPDYDANPNQVYTDFTRQLIRFEGLSILTSAGLSRRCEVSNSLSATGLEEYYKLDRASTLMGFEADELPSWVPDPRPWKAWTGGLPWRPQDFWITPFLWKPDVLLWKGCPHRLALKGAIFDSIFQIIPLRNAMQKRPITLKDDTGQLLGFDEALYYIASVWFHSESRFRDGGNYLKEDCWQVALKHIFTAGGTLVQSSSMTQLSISAKGINWIDRIWRLVELTITEPSYGHIEQALSTGEISVQDVPLFLSSVSLLLEEYICLFTTNGLMGFAPKCVLDNDVFAWIDGYSHPVVLRPAGDIGTYQLVGPCYIHGLMDGELGSMNIPDAMHSLLHIV